MNDSDLIITLTCVLVLVIVAAVVVLLFLIKGGHVSLSSLPFLNKLRPVDDAPSAESDPPLVIDEVGIEHIHWMLSSQRTQEDSNHAPSDVDSYQPNHNDNNSCPLSYGQSNDEVSSFYFTDEGNAVYQNESYTTKQLSSPQYSSPTIDNSSGWENEPDHYDHPSTHPLSVRGAVEETMHKRSSPTPIPVKYPDSSQPIYDKPPPTPIPVRFSDKSQPIYDKPPPTPIPVEFPDSSQPIYDKPPLNPVQVQHGGNYPLYDRPPPSSKPVHHEEANQPLYDRLPSTPKPVQHSSSRNEPLYDRPRKISVPVEKYIQEEDPLEEFTAAI